MKKKQTPLIVLRQTEKILKDLRTKIEDKNQIVQVIENQENYLIHIIDNDTESDFYFKLLLGKAF